MARIRLGWLGPAIVIAGLAIGAVGIWIVIKNKPHVGAVIERIDIGKGQELAIRKEDGGDRNFLEMYEKGQLKWESMIPTYAGDATHRAITWGEIAIATRVIRGGKAEIFALSRADGTKLGGVNLGVDHGAIKPGFAGQFSVTDGKRCYEIVAGDTWNQVMTIDMQTGKALWKRDFPAPAATSVRVEGGNLVIEHAGKSRWFNVFTGKEDTSFETTGTTPWGGTEAL
ncbi:MAG TPA: PQQ-binding-like beta-propeller repeat protein [Kofleriaceae bacterium]|jgi:outer membrane protein assembly factor BamB